MARVDLDMSQPLERAEPCREGFPALGAPTVQGTDVHQVLARVLGEARAVMDGFVHDVDGVVDDRLVDSVVDDRSRLRHLDHPAAHLARKLHGNLSAIIADQVLHRIPQCNT